MKETTSTTIPSSRHLNSRRALQSYRSIGRTMMDRLPFLAHLWRVYNDIIEWHMMVYIMTSALFITGGMLCVEGQQNRIDDAAGEHWMGFSTRLSTNLIHQPFLPLNIWTTFEHLVQPSLPFLMMRLWRRLSSIICYRIFSFIPLAFVALCG